jgi:hypothetical protein
MSSAIYWVSFFFFDGTSIIAWHLVHMARGFSEPSITTASVKKGQPQFGQRGRATFESLHLIACRTRKKIKLITPRETPAPGWETGDPLGKSPGTSPDQQSGREFHMMPSSRFQYPTSMLFEK